MNAFEIFDKWDGPPQSVPGGGTVTGRRLLHPGPSTPGFLAGLSPMVAPHSQRIAVGASQAPDEASLCSGSSAGPSSPQGAGFVRRGRGGCGSGVGKTKRTPEER